jgi:hypothetical protein
MQLEPPSKVKPGALQTNPSLASGGWHAWCCINYKTGTADRKVFGQKRFRQLVSSTVIAGAPATTLFDWQAHRNRNHTTEWKQMQSAYNHLSAHQ